MTGQGFLQFFSMCRCLLIKFAYYNPFFIFYTYIFSRQGLFPQSFPFQHQGFQVIPLLVAPRRRIFLRIFYSTKSLPRNSLRKSVFPDSKTLDGTDFFRFPHFIHILRLLLLPKYLFIFIFLYNLKNADTEIRRRSLKNTQAYARFLMISIIS